MHQRCFESSQFHGSKNELQMFALIESFYPATVYESERKAIVSIPAGIYFCDSCERDLRVNAIPAAIAHFERVGRLEDLARLYELMGWMDKAGETRLRMKKTVVTTVHVNLNELLADMMTNGICIPFKCKSCGASIQVSGETNPDGVAKCKFCGSEMDVMSLKRLVDGML